MTFNDLKKENKLFVVNQGDSFGMRIEEHIINDIKFDELGMKLFMDDTSVVYVDKSILNSNKCGCCFLDKKDAQENFLKKYINVYSDFVHKASKHLKKYNDCVEIMNNMSKEKEDIETELILNGSNLEN